MLEVETEIVAGDWDLAIDWPALARTAVAAALAATPHAEVAASANTVEVSVRLTDDAEVRTLNAQYRHKDQATNVLSFPMVQPDLLGALANSDDGEVLLGDIVLAAETVRAEATAKGVDVSAHTTHLIVHGALHLVGYDHEGDIAAERMEGIERSVLGRLGHADPYPEP